MEKSKGLEFPEFSDNYEHPDPEIEYIVENEIFSTSETTKSFEDLRDTFNSFLSSSCSCLNEDCSTESCSHGENYTKLPSLKGELVLNESRKYREYINECSQFCKCSGNCQNRLVQFGPRDDLEIRFCGSEKGYGLFTKSPIPRGGFVCEYAGELLTRTEAKRRHSEKDPMKYLLCLNEISAEGEKVQTFVDPIRKGNIGRYLNHSCDPNCEILSVRIDNIIPKLTLLYAKWGPETYISLCTAAHVGLLCIPFIPTQLQCFLLQCRFCRGRVPSVATAREVPQSFSTRRWALVFVRQATQCRSVFYQRCPSATRLLCSSLAPSHIYRKFRKRRHLLYAAAHYR
ncbi:histone-lysine N-methyltransferase SETMAR [Lutzomyia longipalpis]|uniref:histone-lysine N-methyltransferase SETMAR n=1 Tax=Lutzomyia longipalpis TaxID=7200 RepID=UPI002483CDB9|nr:histone-lysine N-methyltransferase SETMAR [Lutzomyia longipalpis]